MLRFRYMTTEQAKQKITISSLSGRDTGATATKEALKYPEPLFSGGRKR